MKLYITATDLQIKNSIYALGDSYLLIRVGVITGIPKNKKKTMNY